MGPSIQRAGIREHKTWVQFPLHVAPTPPGSGVLFHPLGVFTNCISISTVYIEFVLLLTQKVHFGQNYLIFVPFLPFIIYILSNLLSII